MKSRGAFVVFEGCDRCGKSTQSKKLVEYLSRKGYDSKYINFPARNTPSGQIINAYLTNKQDLPDQSIHLLFTLNRWEMKEKMQELLEQGTTLIVDRYSYSGVAFSAAKGLDFDWCKAPEAGLLKPDLVLYMKAPLQELTNRGEYGTERYEKLEFQSKVVAVYERLYKAGKDNWLQVDATKSIEDTHSYLCNEVVELIKKVKHSKLSHLWS